MCDSIISAYSKNNIEKVKRTIIKHDIPLKDLQSHCIIEQVCAKNDIEFMKFVVEHYPLTKKDVASIGGALYTVITQNCVPIAKWLCETFKLADYDIYSLYGVLSNIADFGAFDVLMWLYDTYQVQYAGGMLRNASAEDKIDVVKWVINKFGTREAFVCFESVAAIDHACKNNNVEIIEFVAGAFGLGKESFNLPFALRCFVKGGSVAKLQRFTTRFNITPDDIRACDALGYACRKSHLDIARWLVNTFDLTTADAGRFARMLDRTFEEKAILELKSASASLLSARPIKEELS
jgi:hypothetical protein